MTYQLIFTPQPSHGTITYVYVVVFIVVNFTLFLFCCCLFVCCCCCCCCASQEENIRNVMDGDRRQASLERKLHYIEQEIERQQKARTGVEQLAKVYEEQPDFVDEKGANDVNRQLTEVCMVKG